MMYDMNNWKHVFKLDPDKDISDDDLEKICESGTDAVIVGGTDQVTLENVLDLLSRIRRFTVPCVLEISNMESITPGFDFYFIPSVLNSRDRKWISGLHHEAIKEYGDVMNWDEIKMEGYCILNQEAKAFQYTAAELPEKEDVIAYARMAEKMFHFPIFYMEYSGTYGDPELVQAVKNELKDTLLVYGGGIQSAKQAKEMSRYADIIVVGNAIYEDIQGALQTVQAVKQEQ